MEILELAWVLIQSCGCFLEVFAVGSSAGAGVAGHRAYKKNKDREPMLPPSRGPWVLFLILLMAAVAAVTLVAIKWLGG